MNTRQPIERAEYHVQLPVDVPHQRWDGKGQGAIPGPVGCRRETDGFGANLAGEDLGGIDPRRGTPRGRVDAYENVRTGNDRVGDVAMGRYNPGYVAGGCGCGSGCGAGGVAVDGLEGARDEENGHHEEAPNYERGAAAPGVEVDYGGQGEYDVDDVLDRGREEWGANGGRLHDI